MPTFRWSELETEGPEKFGRFVVIEFPSFEQAVACFNSPEYRGRRKRHARVRDALPPQVGGSARGGLWRGGRAGRIREAPRSAALTGLQHGDVQRS
jgi:hypothetical protein